MILLWFEVICFAPLKPSRNTKYDFIFKCNLVCFKFISILKMKCNFGKVD